jgi:hypothetical protein
MSAIWGQYLFGYAGGEVLLAARVAEMERNNIPANARTIVAGSASARLAAADENVVRLVFFRRPGFFEFGETKLCVRDLPQSVRDRHREAACVLGLSNPFVAACP